MNTCDKECAVCGYTRKTNHKFTEVWTTDGSSHWRECTGCGLKQDETAHKPGPEATKTSAQTCTVCGYVLTRALVSEKTAEEKKDETQIPTVQENIPKAEHTTYAQENISDKEGFPVWILIVAAVIAASAVVILVKKKKT